MDQSRLVFRAAWDELASWKLNTSLEVNRNGTIEFFVVFLREQEKVAFHFCEDKNQVMQILALSERVGS